MKITTTIDDNGSDYAFSVRVIREPGDAQPAYQKLLESVVYESVKASAQLADRIVSLDSAVETRMQRIEAMARGISTNA